MNITKEQLNELIKQAYEEGHRDHSMFPDNSADESWQISDSICAADTIEAENEHH